MAEARARVQPSEAVAWSEFFRVEPWGYHGANEQLAAVGATLANLLAALGGKEGNFTAGDFLPSRAAELGDAELAEKLTMLAAAHNAAWRARRA